VNVDGVAERANAVLDEVERAVVGKRDALELVLLGILADGHVLIEDFPGLAKTLMARAFAQVTSIGFTRVQFTPDLMPSDVTGASIYNQREADFEFRPGPIFTNLLLADEINRAPPKTQAALLEAMQERQVTIEGTTHPLTRPFLVEGRQAGAVGLPHVRPVGVLLVQPMGEDPLRRRLGVVGDDHVEEAAVAGEAEVVPTLRQSLLVGLDQRRVEAQQPEAQAAGATGTLWSLVAEPDR